MIPSKLKSSDSSSTHELLKELFPFAFALDPQDKILDLAPLATRIFPEIRLGDSLLDHFDYLTPPVARECGHESWHAKRPLTVSRKVAPHTALKGEIFYNGDGVLYCLWWPVVSDHESLTRLGVKLRELPAHNSLSDLLMVLRNAQLSMEDARRLFELSQKKQEELEATNRKLIGETELIKARHAAEAANEAKTRFLSHMSHELRTPMNAIIGYTETMLSGYYGEIGAKAREPLTRIKINARHLLDLVNKVLDLSVIEAGYLELNLEDYDMSAVVSSALAATIPLAESRGLSLESVIAERLPVGVGDRMRISEILINLLHNAVKFTENGFVRLNVDVQNDYFVIRVTDSGKGIASENLLKIFKDFSKISLPGEMEAGAGLGLAIVDQIVKKHGGTIDVQSALGRGTCFTVRLPVSCRSLEAKAS